MAIKLITGVLGAGKTFYIMHEILNKYFTFDNKFYEWVRGEKHSDIEIITNVDGIKLPVRAFEYDMVTENLSFGDLVIPRDEYFTIPYQSLLPEKKRLLIIDEAQKLFDRGMSPKNDNHKMMFAFFQWSRHLGYDIYLVTQDVSTLARELQNIAEYEVQTSPRSLHLPAHFGYKRVVQGQVVRRESVKKDSRVFMMYKSMSVSEPEKISSAPLRLVVFLGILVICLGFGFSFFMKSFSPPKKNLASYKAKNLAFASSSSALPVAPVSPVPVSVPSIPHGSPSVLSSPVPVSAPDYGLAVGYLKLIDKGKEIRIYEKRSADGSERMRSGQEPAVTGDLVNNTNNSNTFLKNNIKQ